MRRSNWNWSLGFQGGCNLRAYTNGGGIKIHLHAYGTNIEGDWDQVFTAVKQCHQALHAAGVPRISTNMRFGTRIDREQTMEDKVSSVEQKLI